MLRLLFSQVFSKLALLTVLLSASASALAENVVTSTRVWPAEAYTRVTFEADEVFKYQTFPLENPERLVVDIEDISLNTILKLLPTNKCVLHRINQMLYVLSSI